MILSRIFNSQLDQSQRSIKIQIDDDVENKRPLNIINFLHPIIFK